MSSRSLAFAVLLAGAGLALVAGSQPWSRATSGPVSVAFTGTQVTGGLTQTLALTVLAAFPAGTLSGAPKVRAMEIIDALEVSRRGLYGGVVGYLDFAGDADAAIAIRTALLRNGVAYVQAGGGIVADSDPATEDLESQNKAAAVVRAVSVAQSFQALRA